MKRFLCAVAVVMACLVVTGSALAETYTNHVSVAPNGKGDLMVFPVWLATGGEFPIQTKFTIINTSLTDSLVAKIVFRSYVYSQELLDFLIYLSPTDMWVGTIEFGPNGPRVVSADASGPTLLPGQELVDANCDGDSNEIGYVEVIEAWSANLGAPPVAKSAIKTAYDASAAFVPYAAGTTINSLAGSYLVSIPSIGWEATDTAFVMKDYNNASWLNPAVETLIGKDALNTTQEVEAAFNKDNIAMAYNSSDETGGTLHVFTFPTKLSNALAPCSRTSRVSNFFPTSGKVNYGLKMFDNEERTTVDPSNPFSPQDPKTITMDDEVTFKAMPDGVFDFGWALYTIAKVGGTTGVTFTNQPLSYTGVPVIPTIIDFKDGLSIRGGAWTDGVVTDAAGTVLTGYQYTSSYVGS